MKGKLKALRDILKEGRNEFDLHAGIISQVVKNTYKVIALDTDYEQLVEGAKFDLQDTYCKAVVDQAMTKTFKDVAEIKEMQKHPVYLAMQLRAYIGSPIMINNKVWGTLNFSSISPRKIPFSPSEYSFVESLAKKAANILATES